jgi:hypothetical protein
MILLIIDKHLYNKIIQEFKMKDLQIFQLMIIFIKVFKMKIYSKLKSKNKKIYR